MKVLLTLAIAKAVSASTGVFRRTLASPLTPVHDEPSGKMIVTEAPGMSSFARMASSRAWRAAVGIVTLAGGALGAVGGAVWLGMGPPVAGGCAVGSTALPIPLGSGPRDGCTAALDAPGVGDDSAEAPGSSPRTHGRTVTVATRATAATSSAETGRRINDRPRQTTP